MSFDTNDSNNNNKDGSGDDNVDNEKSGTHIDIVTANKIHFCDEPIISSTDIERGDNDNNNNLDAEITAILPSQISQKQQQQPPSSPESPRAITSLSQRAMGQWTKSPGPKTFTKTTMQLSDVNIEELEVPTTTRRRSYHSVNNTNTSRRRLPSNTSGESSGDGEGRGRQTSYNTGGGTIITDSESNNYHNSDD